MIKAAIIEDELLAIERLQGMLEQFRGELTIDVVATTGKDAIINCQLKKPELIFLDIHLPDMKGFEIIKALDYQPYVIFTTAYADYAIDAFQTWAIDYLVKPFDEGQLSKSIDKYRKITSQNMDTNKVDWDKLSSLYHLAKERTSLSVKQGDRIKLIDFTEIAYVVADDKYSKIYLTNGASLFCDSSLKELENDLNASFIRIHRSSIINTQHVKEISKHFKGRFTFHFNNNKLESIRSGASYKSLIVKNFKL